MPIENPLILKNLLSNDLVGSQQVVSVPSLENQESAMLPTSIESCMEDSELMAIRAQLFRERVNILSLNNESMIRHEQDATGGIPFSRDFPMKNEPHLPSARVNGVYRAYMASVRRLGQGESVNIGNTQFTVTESTENSIVLKSSEGYEIELTPGSKEYTRVEGYRVNIYLDTFDEDGRAVLRLNEGKHKLIFSPEYIASNEEEKPRSLSYDERRYEALQILQKKKDQVQETLIEIAERERRGERIDPRSKEYLQDLAKEVSQQWHGVMFNQGIPEEINTEINEQYGITEGAEDFSSQYNLREDLTQHEAEYTQLFRRWNSRSIESSDGTRWEVSKKKFRELLESGWIDKKGRIIPQYDTTPYEEPLESESVQASEISLEENSTKKQHQQKKSALQRYLDGESDDDNTDESTISEPEETPQEDKKQKKSALQRYLDGESDDDNTDESTISEPEETPQEDKKQKKSALQRYLDGES